MEQVPRSILNLFPHQCLMTEDPKLWPTVNYWSLSNAVFLKGCMQSDSHNYIEEHEDPWMSWREGTWLVCSCKIIEILLGFVFQYSSFPLPPTFWRDVDPKTIIFPGVPKICSPSFSYTMQPAWEEEEKGNTLLKAVKVEAFTIPFQPSTCLCSSNCPLQVNRELSCNF